MHWRVFDSSLTSAHQRPVIPPLQLRQPKMSSDFAKCHLGIWLPDLANRNKGLPHGSWISDKQEITFYYKYIRKTVSGT